MKKIIAFIFGISILLSIAVLSQINPITNIVNKINQITPTISLEENKICATEFYDEIKDIYGDCIYYHNYTSCLNTSGANTDCSLKQDTWSFKCKTGQLTTTNNKTECKPNDKFVISIDKGTAILKKQIDFSDWGPCVYNEENNCLIVTCQSIHDGANDGKFHGCKSGTSCQKFKICDDSLNIFYKNSREDFVENDLSFYLPKLALKDVPE